MTDVFLFDKKIKSILQEVHSDLKKLATLALQYSEINFAVTCGLRTLEEQKTIVKQKKSQTLNSRHLTGQAIDIMALPTPAGSWEWQYYEKIQEGFTAASIGLNIPY